MGFRDFLGKSCVANIVAGAVLIGAVIYCFIYKDAEILKYLSAFAAGYLFKRGVEGG